MTKKENIIIRISGKYGHSDLKPELYDIKDIKEILEDVEQMLFPDGAKKRPVISYSIDKGSVVHKFQTSRQTVVGFNAVLNDIHDQSNIDFLEPKSALAFEHLQQTADEQGHNFEISTSVSEKEVPLVISTETSWRRTEDTWVESEFYFYGELTDAGGKSRPNIHIDTKQMGSVTIQTDRNFLKAKEKNLLYRPFGVRAKGRQHLQTGEIEQQSLELIELIDIQKKYDEDYLDRLIERATASWKDVDADEWLHELRGGYE